MQEKILLEKATLCSASFNRRVLSISLTLKSIIYAPWLRI